MTRARRPFDEVYSDLRGGGWTLLFKGNRYYIIFTNDCTRMRWWFPLRFKYEALDHFKQFNAMVKAQF